MKAEQTLPSQNLKYVCYIYLMAVLADQVSDDESKQALFNQIEKCVYFSCLMAISSINPKVRLFYLILHKIACA